MSSYKGGHIDRKITSQKDTKATVKDHNRSTAQERPAINDRGEEA